MTTSSPPAHKHNSKTANAHDVTHLFNFTLPPRQPRPVVNYQRKGKKTSSHYGIQNKERFVNAQYRFIMKPTGDYTVHFADPDIFFQWDNILQVIIPRAFPLSVGADTLEEGNPHCPICFSIPAAPRMTRCGHVFCFPCILRYLSTSANKWARCPICLDSVSELQLKAVRWFEGAASEVEAQSSSSSHDPFYKLPRPGSTLQMRLIERPKLSTLALPRSHTWPSDLLPPHQAPFHFLPDVLNFAKFMLATPAYLLTQFHQDLKELTAERRILTSVNDKIGVSFIGMAEERVRNEMARTSALETPFLKEQLARILREQDEIEKRAVARSGRDQVAGLGSPELNPKLLSLKINDEIPASATYGTSKSQHQSALRYRRNVNPPPPSNSTYYYYQAASGLPYFLHPLEIRILLSHFKSYPSFPNTITVPIEAAASGTVNDELRKRCKYLSHFPEGTDVVFVEADLRGVVGDKGFKNFEQSLKMRAAQRKEKGRKEDRARKKAEEREREKQKSAISWARENSPALPDLSMEDSAFVLDESHISTAPPANPVISGAWGSRSFASALHSRPSTESHGQSTSQRKNEVDLDLDTAWHELEMDAAVKKKRASKLMILGSGIGRGNRRQ